MTEFSKEAEKRITHAVYCGEQMMVKKIKLWGTRYSRAMEACQTAEELDEVMFRLDTKFPHLKLRERVDEQKALHDR